MSNDYLNTLLIQHQQRELHEHLQRHEWLQQIAKQQRQRRNTLTTFLNLLGFNL